MVHRLHYAASLMLLIK